LSNWGDVMAKDTTESSTAPPTMQAHQRTVADALLLLEYSTSSGAKSVDGHPVSHDVVETIETTAAKLGIFEGKHGEPGNVPRSALSAEEWAEFDLAYYDLATAVAPITAETLRNTQGRSPGARTFGEILLGDSPALRFTRSFWYVSLGFAAFVLASNWYLEVMAEYSKTDSYVISRTILELVTPWMYGGLGACVYLLRSAHTYIYKRTFDIRRKPEYFNRILLGMIAGGAIIMFANNVAGDDGTVIQLGSAALGFLAGYNTDLLFNAMERVINALLPKLGIDTVQRASAAIKPIDINTLVDQTVKAKPEDKDHLKALTAHLTGMRPPKKE
jgi:hypothetical protein